MAGARYARGGNAAGVDLYSDAAAFPRTLRGPATALTTAGLAAQGITEAAAWWRVNRGGVLRAHRGVYLAGVTAPDLLDRIRAALAVSPPDAVVGFQTAAALQGFGVVEDTRIHLVVAPGSNFPFRKGIRVHQSVLHKDAPVLWRGIACTAPARTAIDLARVLRRPQGLSILDCALHVQACDLQALRGEVSRHRGLAGIRRARALLDVADGRAQCAQETHLRLLLHDSGLTTFVPQWPVPGPRGRTRYVLDLADPQRRVAAEYDGGSHLGRARHRNDRVRHNWLDGAGWRMRYFTDSDLYRDPHSVIRILRAALSDR
jgi:very-short-patch-repair endonuclease